LCQKVDPKSIQIFEHSSIKILPALRIPNFTPSSWAYWGEGTNKPIIYPFENEYSMTQTTWCFYVFFFRDISSSSTSKEFRLEAKSIIPSLQQLVAHCCISDFETGIFKVTDLFNDENLALNLNRGKRAVALRT